MGKRTGSKRMGGCGCHFTHPPDYTHPQPGLDYHCMRCGHEWRGRNAPVTGVVPVTCPSCRSAYWMRVPKTRPEPTVERTPVPRQDHPVDLTRQDHPTEDALDTLVDRLADLSVPGPSGMILAGVDATLPEHAARVDVTDENGKIVKTAVWIAPEPSPSLPYGVPPPPSITKRTPPPRPAPELSNDTMSARDAVEEDLKL